MTALSRAVLRLGPIVGHTDDRSMRVWICAADPDAVRSFSLRVPGSGVFPFVSTETRPELGTAIAVATGLMPERQYHYQVLSRGRTITGAEGRARTLPSIGSFADTPFVSISCSHPNERGAWPELGAYIDRAQPRFLVMMGDQVYLDDDEETFLRNLRASSSDRRRSIVDMYTHQWSQEPTRTIMANIPTYMMWDDHDIRNGWGSWAPDSPTLATRYPSGKKIFAQHDAYFEDARHVCWHFQLCHGPRSASDAPIPGLRRGMPFSFRCGRTFILVVDNRGARDVWRGDKPILGAEQWSYLDAQVSALGPNDDAFVLIVPLPLTSMAPDGMTQRLVGQRDDDVKLFAEGKDRELLELPDKSSSDLGQLLAAIAGALTGSNLGTFKLDSISDVRDNWAHTFCRAEQEALIRLVMRARTAGRSAAAPRAVCLVGGDLHCGALFDVYVRDADVTISSLVTSGIAASTGNPSWPVGLVGAVVDKSFDVADGIHATLKHFTRVYNFGVTQVLPGATARIENVLVYSDPNSYRELSLGIQA